MLNKAQRYHPPRSPPRYWCRTRPCGMCTAHTSSMLTDIIVCPLPSKIQVVTHRSCLETLSLHECLGFQEGVPCSIGGYVLPPARSARYPPKYSLEATAARRQHLATPSTPPPQCAGSRWDGLASLPPVKSIADSRNDILTGEVTTIQGCSYTYGVRVLFVAGWLC